MELPDIAHNTTGKLWRMRDGQKPPRWRSHQDLALPDFGVEFKDVSELREWLDDENTEEGSATGKFGTTVSHKRVPPTEDFVAVKQLQSDSGDSGDIDRLKRLVETEVNNIKPLSHFHIVETIGSYSFGNMAALLMVPWAPLSLRKILMQYDEKNPPAHITEGLNKHGWESVSQFVASTMGCMAHALAHIHHKNIKHKDIKPDNILICGARIWITDFDLSVKFEAEFTSASEGPPERKVTHKYAAPEALSLESREKRGRAQDIYSLACVFIEIFAVYKKDPSTGKHQNVAELFEENTVKYHQNMPRIVKWMTEQVSGRSDLQLLSLIRAMVSETPRERPTATQVWKELVIIHGDALEAPFCGACCMPQDSHLTKVAKVPHPLAYPSAEISPENAAKSATRTSEFETSYSDANRSPYFRNRYLRIDKIYNLDSVSDANTEGKAGKRILCRKTFHRDQNKEDTAEAKDLIAGLAQTEARLLENLTPCKPNGGARHMVNFEATYREGENFAILTTPVTKYNLHEYLSMVELKRKENVLGSWERVLRESSGCLAGTLSYLHKQGIAHGAVSPENILVDLEDNNKIYLANFGEAAVIKRIKDIREVGSKPQVSDLQPFTQSKTNSRPQNPYAPSQGRMSEEIYNATDVFGLGCAALEMETVRLGSSRDAMWKFLLQDPSQNVTNDDKTSSELANGEQPAYNANDTGSTVRPSKKERVSNVSTDAGSKPQSAKKTRSSNVSKGAGSKSQSAKMKQLPVVNGSNDTESKSQPAGGKRSVREAGSKSQPIEEKQPANGSDDTEFNLQPADGKRPTNEGNEDSSAKSTAEADEDDNSTYTWLSGGPNKNMLYDEPRVLARLPEWIQKQCFAENYGALIVRMMDPEPQKRPTAYEIHCSMSKMKDWNSRMMCGKNCVPEEQGDVEKKKAGLEIKETR